jgi:hypothetical protein
MQKQRRKILKMIKYVFTLYHKVLSMKEYDQQTESLREITDIKRIMERSSRFISLSGLSGISAGICALLGAWIANKLLGDLKKKYLQKGSFYAEDIDRIELQFLGLAAIVFVVAFSTSFFFTWRKAKQKGLPVWDYTSRRLLWNLLIPLVAGGLFILGMLLQDEWKYVAPSCLIFYGLALVNASKYTLADIRYLGYCEIILGLINMQWLGYGLEFWAFGFGLLHIFYGAIMWFKYERNP